MGGVAGKCLQLCRLRGCNSALNQVCDEWLSDCFEENEEKADWLSLMIRQMELIGEKRSDFLSMSGWIGSNAV
jgi:bacterioferritin (cytochrome b1)